MEKKCVNCGTILMEGQAFCPSCGAAAPAETPAETPVVEQPKVCSNCGAPLQEGHEFCGSCGQKVGVTMDANVASAIDAFNAQVAPQKPQKNMKKIIGIVVAAIVVIVVAAVGIKGLRKQNLHNELQKEEWWSYDEDTKLYLDFSEDQIEYSGDFGILGNMEIATIDYEVVDGDTILVNGSEIEVELEDDTIVFTPSFVDSESFSLWLR